MANCMPLFYFIIVSVVNDKDVQRLADLADLVSVFALTLLLVSGAKANLKMGGVVIMIL